MPLSIEIADEQRRSKDHPRLKQAVRQVLEDAGIKSAEISIAIVGDAQIRELNRRYLGHDDPTDVLSFVLGHDERVSSLDGEIVISADCAAREAARYGWTPDDELLLYAIHGALHLVGHDDQTPAGQQAMRKAEARQLARFGLQHRYDESQ